MGIRDGSYHNFGDIDNSSNAFSVNNFDRYSATGTRASDSYGYDQSFDSSIIAYRGFGYYQYDVKPESPQRSYFPNYGSSSQSS